MQLSQKSPNAYSLKISFAGAATSIIFVATKTRLLSRQKYACRDETFVATNINLVVATNTCFLKQNFCREKHNFCRDKHVFDATKVSLSRQEFCRETTNICHDKNNRQKTCFVATKLRLVTAPANDMKTGSERAPFDLRDRGKRLWCQVRGKRLWCVRSEGRGYSVSGQREEATLCQA